MPHPGTARIFLYLENITDGLTLAKVPVVGKKPEHAYHAFLKPFDARFPCPFFHHLSLFLFLLNI